MPNEVAASVVTAIAAVACTAGGWKLWCRNGRAKNGGYGNRLTKLETYMETTRDDVAEIRRDIKKILTRLPK